MKKNLYISIIAFTALFSFLTAYNAAAQWTTWNGLPIAYWDFENNTTRTVLETTVEQQINTSGNTFDGKVGNTTTVTQINGQGLTYGGTAAGSGIKAATWSTTTTDPGGAATTYFQFHVNTSGFSGIGLGFDLYTGTTIAAYPLVGVCYSTNGGTSFVSTGVIYGPGAGVWGNGAFIALPATANNIPNLIVRVYGWFGANTANSVMGLDNFTVFATGTVANAGTKVSFDDNAFYTSTTSGGTGSVWNRNSFTVVGPGSDLNVNNASGIAMGPAQTFAVTSQGTVTFGNAAPLFGTGRFTLAAGCNLRTANPAGITALGTSAGSVWTSGLRTYDPAANYMYNGTTAQVTGTGLPASLTSPSSDTVNNPAGVTLTQATTFNTGTTINLENGNFANSTLLTMNSGAAVYKDNGTFVSAPTYGATVNVTYLNLGNNALAVTTGNELLPVAAATTVGTVTVNKTGATITLGASPTISGNLVLTAGTLDASVSNYNITLRGNWNNNAATTAFTPRSASVILNGTAAQTLGGSFGTTYNNLTLNNAAGASIALDETVNGTLAFTSGLLTIGTKNLIIGPSAPAVAGTPSSASMIVANSTGQVRKQFSANGSFLYPVGDAASNYTPITLNFTGGTYGAGAYAGVNLRNVKHPANADIANYINRYWSVTLSGITSPAYAVSAATYVPGDVVGTESNLSMADYSGALPWVKFGPTNTATHTLSSTTVNTTTLDFTALTTAPPTVSITSGGAYCTPVSVTLSVLSSSGAPSLTYSWAPAAGLSATTGSSVVATPTVTTTYTTTVTDGNEFTNTTTTTITVNASAPITGAASMCLGYGTTLSDAVTGGTWISSNTSVADISSSGVVTGYSAGTTIITYQTPSGCTPTVVVTVNALGPITGALTVCAGSNTTLDDIATGGTWTIAPVTVATVNATTGVVTGVGPGVATVSYTMASGCQATATILVNATPSPITGPSAVCINATITLADPTPGGSWSTSDPSIGAISSGGVVTGISSGTVLISYTVPTGCYVTHIVTVNALPSAITGSHYVCVALTTTLVDATTPGTWSSSNTTKATIDPSSGVVTGVAIGTSVITYQLTTTSCYGLDTITVTPPPTAITGPTLVCAGSTVTLSDGVAGGTWTGTPAIFGSVNATTGVVTGVAGGVYTVSYSTLACNAVSYSVSVNPQPSPITGTGNVCVGASTTLSDVTPYGTWSISGSSASIMPIGTFGGSSAAVVSGVSYGSSTTVAYTLPTGCARIVPIIVDSLPAPITGIDSVCQGFSVTLADISPDGIWSSSDGTKATAIAATGEIIGASYGFATITYSLVSGCYQTVPFTVIEPLPASVTITDTPSMAPLCAGTPITFTAHPVNGGTPTYQWELFGMPTSAADTNSVYVDSPTHGDYIVCYMTVHGVCAAPITVRDSIALNIYPVTNPAVTIMTPHSDSIAYFGEEVTFYSDVSYGGTSPVYQWYINGGPVAGATSSSFTTHIYENDTVKCIVSGNAPCVTGAGTSNSIYIYASQLGVGTASLSNNDLSLSPNPNTGSFVLSGTLGTTSEPVMIEVSDMLGHIVYKDRTMTQGGAIKAQINLDKNIASGTYLLKVSSSTDNQTFHFVVGGN